MRFVHSLWTAPSMDERWGFDAKTATIGNIWYYTLSAAYLKRLEQEIVLHTDNFGKECLSHIPYDNIYLTIEENISKDTCPIMWACSKFYALKNEPLGSLHIDGDVFIKSRKCLNLINAGPYDLFVQGKENIELWEEQVPDIIYEDNEKWLQHLTFPEGVKEHGARAYNTGVIAFDNQELKNKFIDSYFFMYNQVINDEILIKQWEENKDICPDLVIEQRFLYDLAEGYKTRYLLDYSRKHVNQDANEIGFQHVIGKKKYREVDICKRVLKHINEDLYEKTLKKTEEIEQISFQD